MSGYGLGEPAAEAHRRGERVVRRLALLVFGGMVIVTLACGGVFALLAEDWRYPMATAGLVAGILSLWAVAYYMDTDERQ